MPAIRASEKSKEPLNIGPAGEMDYRVRLQFPSNYTVHTPTAVKMSRDYGDYSSTYSLSKGILEGERKLVVKVNELAAARRADYESFRNAAQSDRGPAVVVHHPDASGHSRRRRLRRWKELRRSCIRRE